MNHEHDEKGIVKGNDFQFFFANSKYDMILCIKISALLPVHSNKTTAKNEDKILF